MSSFALRTTAFLLSLIGGLVITFGSLVAALLSIYGSPFGTYYGMGQGMMGGFFYGYGSGWYSWLSLVSLVFGVIVLFGAIMLNARPAEHITWGVIVLTFSVASFIGMGGYFIGAVLGVAGGAIALSYRAPSKISSH